MTTTTYADPHHTMLTLVAGGTVTIEPEQTSAVGEFTAITFPWHASGRKLDDQASGDNLLLCDLVDIHAPTGRASLTTKGVETLATLTSAYERGFRVASMVVVRTPSHNSHLPVRNSADPVAVVGTVCNTTKLPKRHTFDLVPASTGAVCNRCNGVNPYGSGGYRG